MCNKISPQYEANDKMFKNISSILRHAVYISGKTGICSTESNFHWRQKKKKKDPVGRPARIIFSF